MSIYKINFIIFYLLVYSVKLQSNRISFFFKLIDKSNVRIPIKVYLKDTFLVLFLNLFTIVINAYNTKCLLARNLALNRLVLGKINLRFNQVALMGVNVEINLIYITMQRLYCLLIIILFILIILNRPQDLKKPNMFIYLDLFL